MNNFITLFLQFGKLIGASVVLSTLIYFFGSISFLTKECNTILIASYSLMVFVTFLQTLECLNLIQLNDILVIRFFAIESIVSNLTWAFVIVTCAKYVCKIALKN